MDDSTEESEFESADEGFDDDNVNSVIENLDTAAVKKLEVDAGSSTASDPGHSTEPELSKVELAGLSDHSKALPEPSINPEVPKGDETPTPEPLTVVKEEKPQPIKSSEDDKSAVLLSLKPEGSKVDEIPIPEPLTAVKEEKPKSTKRKPSLKPEGSKVDETPVPKPQITTVKEEKPKPTKSEYLVDDKSTVDKDDEPLHVANKGENKDAEKKKSDKDDLVKKVEKLAELSKSAVAKTERASQITLQDAPEPKNLPLKKKAGEKLAKKTIEDPSPKFVKEQQIDQEEKLMQQFDKLEVQEKKVEKTVIEERSVLDSLAQAADKQSSSGWGFSSWGTSFLTSATTSVSTFTSQVGKGLGTVLDAVDSSMGAPLPEALAAQDSKKQLDEPAVDQASSSGAGGDEASITGLLSGFTKGLESALPVVLNTGLDTLELIGRKTMTVLQEGDPGLKNTRKLLHHNKPNLSEVLKEAKLKSEQESYHDDSSAHLVSYSSLFDQHKGLVHLEALEMLAKNSEAKVQCLTLSLSGDQLRATRNDLERIKERCEIVDEDINADENDEFDILLIGLVKDIDVPVNPDKLIECQSEARQWIWDCECEIEQGTSKDGKEIQEAAIRCLAEFTALCMELFHKGAELIVLSRPKDNEKLVTCLTNVCKTLCGEISVISEIYGRALNKAMDSGEASGTMLTNIYFEAATSSSYVRDAFLLLVPIIQRIKLENLLS